MQFSLLDLKMNGTCDSMNFTHLTYLMLLHYLVKVKTPKDITKENCVRCIIASSVWTRVIVCLKFTYLGYYIEKRV